MSSNFTEEIVTMIVSNFFKAREISQAERGEKT